MSVFSIHELVALFSFWFLLVGLTNCIKQCCDAATNFGSINIDKTWTVCPFLVFQFHCLSPLGPECDPEHAGAPCALPGDCIQFSVGRCDGTSLYAFACDSENNFFWTNGSGSVAVSLVYGLAHCSSIPEDCVQPEEGDGIVATLDITVTKVGGGTVALVATGVDNMHEVTTNVWATTNTFTGSGGVTLGLDFDDHSNSSNDGIWKPCCQYHIKITGGVMSVDNTGAHKDLPFHGVHGFLVTGGVTSDCCAASAACTEVDA